MENLASPISDIRISYISSEDYPASISLGQKAQTLLPILQVCFLLSALHVLHEGHQLLRQPLLLVDHAINVPLIVEQFPSGKRVKLVHLVHDESSYDPSNNGKGKSDQDCQELAQCLPSRGSPLFQSRENPM